MARVERVRVRIDASKCDGQGVCKLFTPEWFELDRYGYAYMLSDVVVDRSDRTRWRTAREAEATCPRAAILLQPVEPLPNRSLTAAGAAPVSAAAGRRAEAAASQSAEPESLGSGAPRRDSQARRRGALLAEVGGPRGSADQGGGGFPVARKWAGVEERRVPRRERRRARAGNRQGRVPATSRPFLVLDGALAAAHDRGIATIVVRDPEGEPDVRRAARGRARTSSPRRPARTASMCASARCRDLHRRRGDCAPRRARGQAAASAPAPAVSRPARASRASPRSCRTSRRSRTSRSSTPTVPTGTARRHRSRGRNRSVLRRPASRRVRAP